MAENMKKIAAEILDLCESDPDAGLEFINQNIQKNPEFESGPFGKFAKAIAYGSKGLFQLMRSKPGLEIADLDKEELRDDLGVTDTHLDYLEKGLNEIKKVEEIHGSLRMFGTEEDRLTEENRLSESKVDGMAMVLERCRPGRVQQILGKTKLWYFGSRRVLYPYELIEGIDEWEELSPEDLKIFSTVPFSFHSIVRTALIMEQGTDGKGRKYICCMLFGRTPDNRAPGETINDTLQFVGVTHIFDDGTFSDALPNEHKEQPKKKGFVGKLFG